MSDAKKITLTVKIETACYTVAEVLGHAPAIIKAIEEVSPTSTTGRSSIVKSISVTK